MTITLEGGTVGRPHRWKRDRAFFVYRAHFNFGIEGRTLVSKAPLGSAVMRCVYRRTVHRHLISVRNKRDIRKLKTPVTFWATGVSIKMERAKRLDLILLLMQKFADNKFYVIYKNSNTAGNAPDKNDKFPAEKMRVWAEEIDEIIHVWPVIGQGIQQRLLAIVRAQGLRSTDA